METDRFHVRLSNEILTKMQYNKKLLSVCLGLKFEREKKVNTYIIELAFKNQKIKHLQICCNNLHDGDGETEGETSGGDTGLFAFPFSRLGVDP